MIEKLVLGVPPVLLQWPQRLVVGLLNMVMIDEDYILKLMKIEERRIRTGLVSCESAMGGGED